MSAFMIPVTVIIGRNTVDGVPLSAAAWGRFRARIIQALATQGDFYEMHPGTGIDMKNRVEVNAKLDGAWPDDAKQLLEELLQSLRVEFEQAAILCIWGELEVIA